MTNSLTKPSYTVQDTFSWLDRMQISSTESSSLMSESPCSSLEDLSPLEQSIEMRMDEIAVKANTIAKFITTNAVKSIKPNSDAIKAAVCCLKESDVSKKIDFLKQIEFLDVTGSKVKDLPSEISYLQGLKILILSSNLLTNLPIEMRELPSLNQLNIAGNKFKSVPDFLVKKEIASLKVITANNNLFGRHIPPSLKNVMRV